MAGRKYSRLKKKLDEVVQLDEITVNWKLTGIRSSQIITVLRYKPSELVQLPALLTMWGRLAREFLKREVASQSLKSGKKSF